MATSTTPPSAPGPDVGDDIRLLGRLIGDVVREQADGVATGQQRDRVNGRVRHRRQHGGHLRCGRLE